MASLPKRGALAVVDVVTEILYFPVWWYGAALRKLISFIFLSLVYNWQKFELVELLKNFFTPLFGYYGAMGRVISIALVLFILVGRVMILVLMSLWYLILLLAWLLLWPGSIFMIINY